MDINLFQVNLFVQDFGAALHFYRDQLGLPAIDVDPGPEYTAMVDWASLAAGNTTLELFDAAVAGRGEGTDQARDALELAFIVEDVESTRDRFVRAGVAVDPIADFQWGRCAHFRDPDGNALQIYEVFDTRP